MVTPGAHVNIFCNIAILLCVYGAAAPTYSIEAIELLTTMKLNVLSAFAEAFLACTTHALSTEGEEVMGLLLGDLRVSLVLKLAQAGHLNCSNTCA